MSDKETFGSELAKQLPVKEIYADLAHPTLSTVGQALQGITRVALAPVTALVWGYDKISDYLDVAIPEYLDNLHRLGLVEIFHDRYLSEDSYYEELRKNPNYVHVVPSNSEKIIEKKSMYELSELGKKFCSICIG